MLQERVGRAPLCAFRLLTTVFMVCLVIFPSTLLHAQEATPGSEPQPLQTGSITILSADPAATYQFQVVDSAGEVLETGLISGTWYESHLLVSTPGSTVQLTLWDPQGNFIAQIDTSAAADGSIHGTPVMSWGW